MHSTDDTGATPRTAPVVPGAVDDDARVVETGDYACGYTVGEGIPGGYGNGPRVAGDTESAGPD